MSLGKISLACLLDFILVHVCMAMALAFAVTFHAILGDQQTAHNIATEFPQYYWHCFWPLSLIFPAVFMASGFYQKPDSILFGIGGQPLSRAPAWLCCFIFWRITWSFRKVWFLRVWPPGLRRCSLLP